MVDKWETGTLILALGNAHRTARRFVDAQLRAVSTVELVLLDAIGGGSTAVAVPLGGVERSVVCRKLGEMEDRGLVSRNYDSTRRRVTVTPLGQEVRSAADCCAIDEFFRAYIGAETLATVLEALGKLNTLDWAGDLPTRTVASQPEVVRG